MAPRKGTLVAVATEEIQTEATVPATEEKTKRPRVNLTELAAQNPNEKVALNTFVPAGLKLLVKQASDEADKSEAQLIRDLLAERFNYAIPESFTEKRGRRGSYGDLTPEERKAKIAEDAAKKRENINRVLAALAARADAPSILSEMGLDPNLLNDLPKPKKVKA